MLGSREDYPREMRRARRRAFQACRARRIFFLELATPATLADRLDEGVRIIAGGDEALARQGRTHLRRTLPA